MCVCVREREREREREKDLFEVVFRKLRFIKDMGGIMLKEALVFLLFFFCFFFCS